MSALIARPLAGPGLLARAGDLVLVCADGPRSSDLLDLFDDVVATGGDGSSLVRRLAAALANDFDGGLPACAAAGPASDGRHAVLVYGTAIAEVGRVDGGGDGAVLLTGTEAVTSVNRLFPGPIVGLRLQLPGAAAGHPRA